MSRFPIILLAVAAFLAGMLVSYFAIPEDTPNVILTLVCPANADGSQVETHNIPVAVEDGAELRLECPPVG